MRETAMKLRVKFPYGVNVDNYCQDINCAEAFKHSVTAGGPAKCPKCLGTWVGNEPPKQLKVVPDATRGLA